MLSLHDRQYQTQQIRHWWQSVQHQMALITRITDKEAADLRRLPNLADSIHDLQAHFDHIQTIDCPDAAIKVQRVLYAYFTNVITALKHFWFGNMDDAQVLFDIAIVNRHLLNLYLEEYNLAG